MTASYWNKNGTYQAAADALEKLVPDEGRVDKPYKNKALERFRKACNLYYRLHNDGDFKVGAARMFNVDYPSHYRFVQYTNWGRRSYWAPALYELVNLAMDEIVKAAAEEQSVTI